MQEGTDTAGRAERRGLPRWHLADDAILKLDPDADVRCALRNVSGSGIALETDVKPEVGDEAEVHVRALGRFKARVMRVADDHVALRFLVEDESQILLLQRLERRLVREQAGEPVGDEAPDADETVATARPA